MKINLLPGEETIKSLTKEEITKRLLLGASIAVVLAAAIFVTLTINLTFKKSQNAALTTKYENYINLKNEVQELREDVHALNVESELINSLFFKKVFWSEKLLILSKIMPAELWLKTIQMDDESKMRLKGFLLPAFAEERPIAILSKFIRNLQENKEFFKDFSEISLVNVKSVPGKGKEVYEFNIALIIGKK